jgi:hypothetical protein
MISDGYIGPRDEISSPEKDRKSGRPRAIPLPLEHLLATSYKRGCGYRAIARILRQEHLISSDYSSVRRALKRPGLLPGSS